MRASFLSVGVSEALMPAWAKRDGQRTDVISWIQTLPTLLCGGPGGSWGVSIETSALGPMAGRSSAVSRRAVFWYPTCAAHSIGFYSFQRTPLAFEVEPFRRPADCSVFHESPLLSVCDAPSSCPLTGVLRTRTGNLWDSLSFPELLVCSFPSFFLKKKNSLLRHGFQI